MKIRPCGRFAPSPTGDMHLGNVWTALLSWLYIRNQQGTMILRMEDLDPERSKAMYGERLLEDLDWLGLDYDEGPDKGTRAISYEQSKRQEIYETFLAALKQQGLVYPCFCSRAQLHSVASAPHAGDDSPIYAGTCRNLSAEAVATQINCGRRAALRLKVAAETIEFVDEVGGEIREKIAETAGDFIVRRSDGVYAYQLAVVVDDALMGITHVVRGDDLLSSTARQIYLYRLFGFQVPHFIHVPLLYGMDGHRLSKRHQSLSLAQLKRQGASAEQVIGYLAWLAGWQEKKKPLRACDLISRFSLRTLPQGNIKVDEQDLADCY